MTWISILDINGFVIRILFTHNVLYRFRWAKCPAAAKAGYEKKAGALKVKQQAEMAKYKAAKAKAAGPKRALSAFFMFAADERPKVVSANPSASIGEIGKELGARYGHMSIINYIIQRLI